MRFAPLCLAALAALASTEASAYRLNVVAASEVQLEPEVRSGATALAVRLRLRDDRGAALARRAVTLTFRGAGIAELERRVLTDANGAGAASVEVGTARRVRVEGSFAGDSTASSARGSIEVDLDAPFVVPELVVPGEGIVLGGPAFEAVVNVRVGQVQAIAPGRLGVEIAQVLDAAGRRRALAAGETEATGRASLVVPTSRLEGPGVVRLVPRVDLGGGRVVDGVPRDLLVRARTVLSLLREPRDEDDDAVMVHGVLLAGSGSPVPNAAVRIVRAERTMAAARTNAQGHFAVRLGPESTGEAGVVVRAVFEPTEPWFFPCESPDVVVTAPAPPPIRWTWAATSLGLAALAIAFITLRRKQIEAPTPTSGPPAAVDHVERLATDVGSPGTLRVVFVPVDRATGSPVPEARVRIAEGGWWRCEEGALEVPGGRVGAVLEAEGFAPREITVTLPREGIFRVQVAMRSWREELFERVRPWLGTPPGSAPRTPRELSAKVGGAVATLAAFVERGTWGPEAPGVETVARADELARAVGGERPKTVSDRR